MPDDQLLRILDFHRSLQEEEAANRKAVEFLRNSPYRDKLANAGIFLKALARHVTAHTKARRPSPRRASGTSQSLRGHGRLMKSAPELQPAKLDQLAALPLGARVLLDPWSDRVSLIRPSSVALVSPREKKSFEITPLFPYLTRLNSAAPKTTTQNLTHR